MRKYRSVTIRGSVSNFSPEKAFAERISNGLSLPSYGLTPRVNTFGNQVYTLFFKNGVRGGFQLSDNSSFRHPSISPTDFCNCTFFCSIYFGSHWTYPLLTPFTSLTTSSNESKSRAVTASNATSNKTRDHSKNAYLV